MIVAISNRKNSFSERWVEYLVLNKINFFFVDIYETNIIKTLKDGNVTHFMWHINHSSEKETMLFPYLMNSLEKIGIKTFPNFDTRWHFDDKIAQKYLLESINAPMVPSYILYDEKLALEHLKNIDYPIVAKLKRGAGATNVKLLSNRFEAEKYIKKMFSVGINPNTGILGNISQKYRVAKNVKNPLKLFTKVLKYIKSNIDDLKIISNEKGYFYYQKFLPNNNFDTRVIIVGGKAIAIRRFNRKNDFRASGSGKIDYDFSSIDKNMIAIAFDVAKKINSQSLAFDFIYDKQMNPRIVEICFGFSMLAYDNCLCYWDENLNIHDVKINLQYEMIKLFLDEA